MKETIKKTARYCIGWSLIILGVVGLFLPFLQGIAMIIAGLVILENKYIIEWFKKIKERCSFLRSQKPGKKTNRISTTFRSDKGN